MMKMFKKVGLVLCVAMVVVLGCRCMKACERAGELAYLNGLSDEQLVCAVIAHEFDDVNDEVTYRMGTYVNDNETIVYSVYVGGEHSKTVYTCRQNLIDRL